MLLSEAKEMLENAGYKVFEALDPYQSYLYR